ncbi:recombinase family protein [Bacillus sp. NEB1478]|uniref:recombinase family protein n=1 Tax=Bacillus sp. NEB1478 TaxID=3073816 RepID=UPI002873A920|nr:recombinase family protein [Bacillus sp. NEB1478]WNB93417.1 recombinase family protein [Bacillus sp. NEB1478]
MKNNIYQILKYGVAYVRTSSLSNPKESIPNQIKEIKKHCKKNNVYLLKIFIDEAKTGTSVDNREQYKLFRQTIENEQIDTVMVSFSNRLGRESYEIAMLLSQVIKKRNLEFVSVSEGLVTENLSPLQIAMISLQAEMENNIRIKVTQEGWKKALEQGKFAYGTVPFGYQKNAGSFLEINEKEATIVRKVFELFIEGFNTAQIEEYLRQNKISKPDGSYLTRHHAYNILKNRTYTGRIYKKSHLQKPHSKKRIYLENTPASTNPHPAIISEVLFDTAQEIKSSRSIGYSRAKQFHLLSRCLCCPFCSSVMYGEYRSDRYVCRGKINGEKSCLFSLKKNDIEEKVFEFLKKLDVLPVDEKSVNLDRNVLEIKNKNSLLLKKSKLEINYAKGKLSSSSYEKCIAEIENQLKETQMKEFKVIGKTKTFSELIERREYKLLATEIRNQKMKFTLDENENVTLVN